MNMVEIITKNRSYRRYDNSVEISEQELLKIINTARLTPSAANLQPIRYALSANKISNDKIFPLLKWAAYLKDWSGPSENERPSGYITLIADTRISKNFLYDAGIISQTILLQAVEKGLGGCIFLSVNRDVLKKELNLPEEFEIISVIALGKPTEEIIIEETDDNIKYWRDEQEIHHVPKRKLEDLIIRNM